MDINKKNELIAYKCCTCGRVVVDNKLDEVFFYPVINTDNIELPTCSETCANKLKDKIIKDYEVKINFIKNQIVEKEIW